MSGQHQEQDQYLYFHFSMLESCFFLHYRQVQRNLISPSKVTIPAKLDNLFNATLPKPPTISEKIMESNPTSMDPRLPINNGAASAANQSIIGYTQEELEAAASLLSFSRLAMIPASSVLAVSLHGDNCYYCPGCPRVFHEEGSLCQHLDKMHQCDVSPKPFGCPMCGLRFICEASRNVHKANIHDRKYFCKYCQAELSNPEILGLHLYQHHPREAAIDNQRNAMDYGCRQCGMPFAHEKEASAHFGGQCRRVVGEDGIARCPLCPREFAERDQVAAHMRLAHQIELSGDVTVYPSPIPC